MEFLGWKGKKRKKLEKGSKRKSPRSGKESKKPNQNNESFNEAHTTPPKERRRNCQKESLA